MLTRDITFDDWDDETVTEKHYFNLTEPEIIEWEASHGQKGLAGYLKEIIRVNDPMKYIELFKEFVLMAYGERSEDGRLFIKNDEIRERFQQTAAYPALYMELANDADGGADFIIGIMPKKYRADLQKRFDEEHKKSKAEAVPAATGPTPPTT